MGWMRRTLVLVDLLAHDVEAFVQRHLDHAAVREPDLDPVGRAVVAGLGLDDGAATGVLECSRRGLLQL